MVKQVLRYVCILVGIIGLLLTNALQYTHNTTHHECETDSHRNAHKKSTATGECALCWFVSHQVITDFTIEELIPEIAENAIITSTEGSITIGYQSIKLLLKSNKDPPILV